MRTDGHNKLADTLKGIFGFKGGYSEAAAYLARKWKFTYPKAERVKVGGKVFFDA